ncbi:MAG: hypothetical protein KGJ07_06360, partial [Patescibacteria group bacterium]|nr:hypothetical protein [Patescibacteria group bacterium]
MSHIQQFRVDYLLHTLFTTPAVKSTVILSFFHFLPLLEFLLACLLSICIVLLIRSISSIQNAINEPSVLLALIPPSNVEQSALMTEQLATLLHSLGERQSIKDNILGIKHRYSLEIVSSRDEGIRYLLRTNASNANIIQKALLSYLPTLSITTVNDYIPEHIHALRNTEVIEFTLSKHFALPLRKHDTLDEFDPISYITGMMTKLLPSELISIQLLICPSRPREVGKIKKLIFRNGDVVTYVKKPTFMPFFGVQEGLSNMTLFEQEFVKKVNDKISQPLFASSLRVLLVMNDKQTVQERTHGIISSFATFSRHEDQTIIPVRNIFTRHLPFVFQKRLFGMSKKALLSVSEVSSLYHFPYSSVTKTENVVKTYSKELPAPLSLK